MARRMVKAAAAAGLALAGARLARPCMRSWGATDDEVAGPYPGDDAVTGCVTGFTRAVTVHAAPASIWPWLVQMGQDRAGLYSYDWLENLFGLRIHNADRIVPEWQDLAVGDAIRLVPEGWLGSPGMALPVVLLEPERSIVLETTPAGTWSFHLVPLGPAATRLISRGRTRPPAGPLDHALDATLGVAWDLTMFVMDRGMLLGIKERVERSPAARSTAAAA